MVLEQRNGIVRSVDIATELGFAKPSVSRAMGILKKAGYIVVDGHGHILLTEEGREKARQVYERHTTISTYLQFSLGVSKEVADQDACRMEHVISQESFDKIKLLVESCRAQGVL